MLIPMSYGNLDEPSFVECYKSVSPFFLWEVFEVLLVLEKSRSKDKTTYAVGSMGMAHCCACNVTLHLTCNILLVLSILDLMPCLGVQDQ